MNRDIRLLVVDDEESMRDFLRVMLKKEGYSVQTASNADEAFKLLEENIFELVITDIQLENEKNGVDVLKQTKKLSPETIVLMITAYATIENAIEAFREGAWDYIMKPFDVNEIKIKIKKALEKRRLELEVINLRRELEEKYKFQNLIGKDEKMIKIFELIKRVAQTDTTVLITGESGTGKDLVARAIHFSSHRRNGPFVSINCPALPENLLESELFGHMKGSFTGAIRNKEGLFEQANNGTIFLDEIAELSPHMQVKLLTVLQEKKFRRVGGNQEIHSDFRLITATNRDMQKAIDEGKFRDDLWYRINVIQINMPALRERNGDIPILINYFFVKFRDKTGKELKSISPEAMAVLENYDWPGNVRELENVIERAVTLETENQITTAALPEKIIDGYRDISEDKKIKQDFIQDETFDLEKYIDNEYKAYIRYALEKANGVQTKAAEILKMPVRSFRYLLDKYNLKS